MRINTNIASMTALEANKNTNSSLNKSLEKLSSGLKINKAADDASGLAIADKLRTQASSIGQGISNANSAVALLQIADKAMSEQSNILDTVKQKLMQASTTTTSDVGREAIRKDIVKLLDQFDKIAASTNYNGTTLLQRSAEDMAKNDKFVFQLGETAEFNVTSAPTSASNTFGLGGGSSEFGASSINTSITQTNVQTANTIGGAQYGNGTAGDNNIDAFGSQEISTSGAVSIASASFDASTGVEGAGGQSIDITISGNIGTIKFEGNVLLDISSETQEVKDKIKAIVNAEGDANIKMNADGNVSINAAGKDLDFSSIEFSALKVEAQAADEAVTVNSGNSTDPRTFTIRNNYGENQIEAGIVRGETGLNDKDGQLNLRNALGYDMKGGPMLSDLKDLQENELTSKTANVFMETIDEALTELNTIRSDFGSSQNQLESSIRNMQTTQTNLKNAESVIRDVDYAYESANFNKMNIISQAGTYAISQANNVQQNVMKLLQ